MPDDASKQERLSRLPKVDEVLRRADVEAATSGSPRWAVVEAIRREIDALRKALLGGTSSAADVDAASVARRARELVAPSLRRVINATGVVLHTNLGRAPLAAVAAERVAEIARGYANLEYDIDGRGRGSRHDHLRGLIAELTGAEAAVVVNNNAAAVLVTLSAMAAGREVIVSRGELVEIGGSFRVPDVMRASGARLVEVGTTNKTRRRDYEDALAPETAALLKVHRSNFAIVGFTEEVSVAELVEIGRPVIVDLGSGTLIDPAEWGLPAEPTVGSVVRAGATLVTFSGDKLLGGPQAGVIVGNAVAVERARKHPLMRALRPDKMTLAALEATLELYRDGRAVEAVPALRMLSARPKELAARANELAVAIGGGVEVVEIRSAVGGGALPLAEPVSSAIALPEDLDGPLRLGDPCIVGRIVDGRLLLDVRTILPDEVGAVSARVRECMRTPR